MPEKKRSSRKKSPSSRAGEYVREEIHHVREGKHGARSSKQVIAIGLSKARRAGVDLPPPKPGTTSERTRRQAARDLRRARTRKKVSRTRSQGSLRRLKRYGTRPASHEALSDQARNAARRRGAAARSLAARKGARTRARRAAARSRR